MLTISKPGIENRVNQINQKVDQNKYDGKDDDDALNQRKVTINNCVDRHVA
jgi:hypothetical protein